MKGIKKTLVASALACATLNAAQAEGNSWSYGIKAGVPFNGIWDVNEDARFNNSGAQDQKTKSTFLGLLKPYVSASLFLEYAFTNYLGLEVQAGYMPMGGVIKAVKDPSTGTTLPGVNGANGTAAVNGANGTAATSSDDKNAAVRITTHNLYVPLSLCIYPMGREEGEDVFKFFAGAFATFPLNKKMQQRKVGEDKFTDVANAADNMSKFGFGMQAGFAYEWSFGLSLETRGGINFMNVCNDTAKATSGGFKTDTAVGLTNLNKVKGDFWGINLGYNFASLFSA